MRTATEARNQGPRLEGADPDFAPFFVLAVLTSRAYNPRNFLAWSRQRPERTGCAMSQMLADSPAQFGIPERRANYNPSLFQPTIRPDLKKQVQRFWQSSPCDSWFTKEERGTPDFYRSLDEHRYKLHRRLQAAVGFEKTRGLRVLEIGCGCGSEAERFARAGAHYTAVDLTNAAVSITQRRFELANLKGRFVQGDAENLPFADGSFDLVYSHGVLHHTPDTPQTIREVHRVLSPGGRAVIMLYFRDSFNYRVNLGLIRRLRAPLLRTEAGVKIVRAIWRETEEQVRRHAELVREDTSGYMGMQNMLNSNTDGADNPLSQVFSKSSAKKMFSQFKDVKTEVTFWSPNWLPGIGKVLPSSVENWLASHWGWHLWIYAQKNQTGFPAPAENSYAYAGITRTPVLAEAMGD
jgi:ubiquinone/menaquinone biosynthesis C-methylase UbiE